MTGVIKSQIDWLPLSEGSVRPTQGRTLAVMQVSGGSQSFNAVNCPSSDDLGHSANVQERRLWSIWGERLGGLRVVAQAAIHQGLALDAFPLGQDPFAASEVDVSGRKVAQALMGSGMIVVFDEVGNLRLQLAGQVGVFEQDAVLERLMPTLDLALRLRMAWRTADVRSCPDCRASQPGRWRRSSARCRRAGVAAASPAPDRAQPHPAPGRAWR